MSLEIGLKEEFGKVMKGGKVAAFKLIDEADSYIDETSHPTILETSISEIIKKVRDEKRFYFNQFKEVYPFILSERKLREALEDKDEFIVLD